MNASSRQSPPGPNGAGSAQSSPGNTKTKKSGSGALSDFTKRFKVAIRSKNSANQNGTPTATSSFKGLRALRTSRDSESSIASSARGDRGGSLKNVHHSDEDEDEDDEDDKILQFEQAIGNLQFKVDEAGEKLANLEKKLDDNVYDERKYNKKRVKYEQQIESANAKIKEIMHNIEAYREQKRKGGEGGMLNSVMQGSIMQIFKMGKRGGTDGSSKLLAVDSSVGSDDERFDSPMPVASPKQKRPAFFTPSTSTGSASDLAIPPFSDRRGLNKLQPTRMIPTSSNRSSGDVGMSGEKSPSDDVGGDRRERTRTVTLGSEPGTAERMPSSETTPTGQSTQGAVEPGSSVGGKPGMPRSTLAERRKGTSALPISISDPDFINHKNMSLTRLKNIMHSDGNGRDGASTPIETGTPPATQSAKKSKQYSFPTLRHKKDKNAPLNLAPAVAVATNDAFFSEISERLAKLMDDTMNLTKLANDQVIAREADGVAVRKYREELAEHGKVLDAGHALITDFDEHVQSKIKDEAASLADRIKTLEGKMDHEKVQVEKAIDNCQILERDMLAHDEKMLEQINDAQKIHQAYERRRTGPELAAHWYNCTFTTVTHKAVFWLTMLTFVPLIFKMIFKVGQEVDTVVETAIGMRCHADNCTSICESKIQEAIEELQSP
jgi:hypothetical protein